MKALKFLGILFLLVIAHLVVSGQDAYHSRLVLPPCEASGTSSGKVRLVNGGVRAVRLANVRFSCGCLHARPLENSELAPGESAEVEFSFSANGKKGQLKQRAWLEFAWTGTQDQSETISEAQEGNSAETPDDPRHPVVVLTDQGQVEIQLLMLSRLHLGLSPAVADFGEAVPGQLTDLEESVVRLEGQASSSAVITSVEIPSDSSFAWRLADDGKGVRIWPMDLRHSAVSQCLENWTLHTDDERRPALRLAVSLSLKRDFTMVPERFAIPESASGEYHGTLLLKSLAPNKPVKVLSVTWKSEDMDGQASWMPLPRGLTRILVDVQLPVPPGAELWLTTDSSVQPEVRIPLTQDR